MKNALFILLIFSSLGYGGLQSSKNYEEKKVERGYELGALLFFDTDLSYSKSISCANCHDPSLAFTDGYRTSFNAYGEPLDRNSPTLLNISDNQYFNWSSPNITTIQDQLTGPFYNEHPDELGWEGNKKEVLIRLAAKGEYHELFYQNENIEDVEDKILSALTNYLTSLISRTSKFDRDADQRHSEGFLLFKKFQCLSCHGGIDFDKGDEAHLFFEVSTDDDCELIRTPTLRNVAVTKPYFHDGRYVSMEAAIKGHYESIFEMNKFYKPSELEVKEIIRFLHCLTDTAYIRPFNAANEI